MLAWDRRMITLAALGSLACGGSSANEGAATSASATSESGSVDASSGEAASAETGSSESGGDPQGLDLLDRLGGLWLGPVTMTPLGNFATMNMDIRAADERTLFSRVDLDASNALRFSFALENHSGSDVLVYRNGGLFSGLSRDTRTVLHEAQGDQYRFCALDGGCDYIDALFDFDAPDQLLLDVKVMGEAHVYWLAERVEPSSVPDSFPAAGSAGDGSQDFPPLPSLEVDVTWTTPLVDVADVWVLLANQDCPLMGSCDLSRFIQVEVDAGGMSGHVTLDQIHPGDYKATAVLDRDQNLGATFAPGTGDGVSLPNASITVTSEGPNTATIPIVVDL